MKQLRSKKLTQMQIIAIGHFMVILVGTLLLQMPFSSRTGEATGFLTALFTATSATCVTGLVVVDTYQYWSLFGQIIILLMIQIGGLGFISIGIFFSMFLKRNIGLRERGLIQESFNTLQLGGAVKLVKKIMLGTLMFEGIGAILLSIKFIPRMGWAEGIYNGIFHSVSAFCNAGFDLMGKYEAYSSFVAYQDDILLNVVIMSLIVIGGIGFIVWDDISRNGIHFKKYMMHTKVVLTMTTVLILTGAVLFYIFEKDNVLADASPTGAVLASLFNSVTARTAGFNSTDTGAITQGSSLLTSILMFIGGSPGSTAGGIKTTTTVVLLLVAGSYITNSSGVNVYGRRIQDDAIRKAVVVFVINLSMLLVATIAICAMQPFSIGDVLFEVASGIGTVGMTRGITRDLNSVSRVIIVLLMYCGRIGSMTFAMSFAEQKKPAHILLPAGQISIG